MGKLIYSVITSLDGYVADADGSFEWAFPDDEVHAFANELDRPIGTHLYGRRLYEVMLAWETIATDETEPAVVRDYAAIWRASDKVVFSSTLTSVSSRRTRIEATFDPDAVRRLVRDAPTDVAIGGPGLASHALRHGLVDEITMIVFPTIVGGGTAALPDDLRIQLALLAERRFGNGAVHLHYRVTT